MSQNDDNDDLSCSKFLQDIKADYRELLKLRGVDVTAKQFETLLEDAGASLIEAATAYHMNRHDEVLIPRVSDILRELGELSRLPAERWPQRLNVLDATVFEALLGGFPFSDVSYTPVDFDDKGRAAEIPDTRPAFVPLSDEHQRQDLKHQINESSSGFVRPMILPGFADMVCRGADAEALAGIVQDMIHLLLEMPNLRALMNNLAHRWNSVATNIFARNVPVEFARTANDMEDDSDQATRIFLQFVAQNAGLVFDELRCEPGTVTGASQLAAETTERILKAGNLAERRKGFTQLAKRDPDAFLNALRQMIARIELQYNKADNPTGMGRRTTRAYVAPALWLLMRDVLHRIWPEKLGPLSKATNATVLSIALKTYNRGELEFERFASPEAKRKAASNTGIGNKGNSPPGPRDLVVDHFRHAVSYRNARYQLDSVRQHLERELREVRGRVGVNHLESRKLEATVRVLALWRREMEWRLLHGPLEKEQRRKSSISFPPFPQMGSALSLDDRVSKIIGKAQPLIDDMLATMTAPSSKGAIPAETCERVSVDRVD